MPAINLLPEELAPKGPMARLANFVRKVTIYGYLLFLTASFGLLSIFLFDNLTLRERVATGERLKDSIRAQEQTEQGVILIRDRLGKIKDLGDNPTEVSIESLAALATALPVNVSEVEVVGEETEVTVTVANSSLLKLFLDSVVLLEKYKSIQVSSFGFIPQGGYQLTLELSI